MAKEANNVTLKVSNLTKALMEAYAAEHLAKSGDSLTNDEIIAELVKEANPELFQRLSKIAESAPKKPEEDNK